MSEPINIPPALVLGCNTPHGIGVLSDFIQEQNGFPPELHESGWTDYHKYNINYVDNSRDYGSINGHGYGYSNGDGDGDGNHCFQECGDGCGWYVHYGNSCGNGNGCGCFEYGHEYGYGI